MCYQVRFVTRSVKCMVTMRWVMAWLAQCAISSHVILRSSSRIWSTPSTLWSSVDVRGHSLCSTFPHESVEPSVKLCFGQQFPHHTLPSANWISVGVFPRNVSILMYARWLSLVTVPEIRTAAISTPCRFQVHTPPETNYTALAARSSPVQLLKWRERLSFTYAVLPTCAFLLRSPS